MFDGLAVSKLRQGVPSDPRDCFGGILNSLGLPLSADETQPPVLERHTGEYVRSDHLDASRFVLKTGEGCLIVSFEHPTLDVHAGPIGCYREMQLVPKAENCFYVSAWPHEVSVVEDRMGTIVEMRVGVTENSWTQCREIYLKL